MKKDLLIMCQFFYPEAVSSALLPYETAKGLVNKGLTVDVLCGYPKEYAKKGESFLKTEVIDGITVFRKKYVQYGRKGFISRLINYFSFTLVMFFNLFKMRKYKVLMVYSNPPILPLVAVIAKKIFNCKIIFVGYDLYPEIAINTNVLSETGMITKVMNYINKLLYPNVSRVVALSSEMKDFILRNRNINASKIEVIPNWATENFEETKIIENDKLNTIRQSYDLIISYFGNMGTAQDMDSVIQIAREAKVKNLNIAFLFAGHGNKKAAIAETIEIEGLSDAYMFDYLKGRDFIEALNISDLFVVSLANELNGLAVPSKTYSYYQAGKPVIAIMNKNSDIAEEITEYCAGLAIENGQISPLTDFIEEILFSKERLESIEQNVLRLYREKHTREAQIVLYEKMILTVLEEN